MHKHRRTLLGQYYPTSGTAGLYSPVTQTMQLSSDWKYVLRSRVGASVFLHECMHYWQGISTTYGFYYAELSALKVHILQRFVREASDRGIRIHCPIRRWEKRENDQKVKNGLGIICRLFDMISSHLTGLEGGLVDESTKQENEVIARGDWDSILAYLECGLRPPSVDTIAQDRHLELPEGQIAPIIEGNAGKRYALGAERLSEGFAYACQYLLAFREAGNNQAAVREVARALAAMHSNPEYCMATNLIIHFFSDIPDIDARAWYLVPSLVDLALNGPLLPELRPAWLRAKRGVLPWNWTPRLNWREVHPGFRFLLALKALAETGLLQSETWSIGKIISAICSRLKWLTPTETAAEMLKVLDHKEKCQPEIVELMSMDGACAWDLWDFRYKSFKKACALRVEDPNVLSCPVEDYPVLELIRVLPPVLIKTFDGVWSGKDIEMKHNKTAEDWETIYTLAIGLVEDPQLLRAALVAPFGGQALEGVFGIKPEEIAWS